jgi:hypothetical protein
VIKKTNSACLNPEIMKFFEKQVFEEGYPSYPGLAALLSALKNSLRYYDLQEMFRIRSAGLLSTVIQSRWII